MKRRKLAVGGAVLGGTAALGAALGPLWWLLAPRPQVTVGRDGRILPLPVSDADFAVDGFFVLIMTAAGLACGYTVYIVQYRLAARDAADLRMVCLVSLAAGSLLGAFAAWQVGTLIDAAEFRRVVSSASPGTVVRSGLQLHALSALMVWPFVAVLQYGLFDAVSLWRGDVPAERRAEAPGAGEPAASGRGGAA
ncbi:hypothetical protein, partial [Streptomonospora salina]